MWNQGDEDFQDIILAALTPINVDVRYCPKTLNLKSEGRCEFHGKGKDLYKAVVKAREIMPKSFVDVLLKSVWSILRREHFGEHVNNFTSIVNECDEFLGYT